MRTLRDLTLLAFAFLLACGPAPSSGDDDDDAGEPVPVIQHNATTSADEGVGIPLDAVIDPPEGREDEPVELFVNIHHRTIGADAWTDTQMTTEDGNAFDGVIPAAAVTAEGLEYYISAVWADVTGYHPPSYPDAVHTVTVSPASLANPGPVRARWDEDAAEIQVRWTDPGTSNFADYEVHVTRADGSTDMVCSGTDRDAMCTVDEPALGDDYADWEVIVRDVDANEESADGFTDNLHLFEDKWGATDPTVGTPILGDAAGEFSTPIGVAVDGGSVFVVEQGNERVQVLSTEGLHQRYIGGPGENDGQFRGPADIAIGPSNRVYVADFSNGRVQAFDRTDGAWRLSFGQIGSADGDLHFPSGLAFDGNDQLHVVETVNERVSVFDADGGFIESYATVDGESLADATRIAYVPALDAMAIAAGNMLLLKALGEDGEDASFELVDAGEETRVAGLCVTEWNEMIVALDGLQDTFSDVGHTFVKVDAAGEIVGGFGQWGVIDGEFFRPVDCGLAGDGTVFAVDHLNHRIQVFGP
jgi:hypothetical protein